MRLLHSFIAVLCIASLGKCQATDSASENAPVAEVFRSVLPVIKEQTRIPILLPSEFPVAPTVRIVPLEEVAANEYKIALWIEVDNLPTFFTAMFAAKENGQIPDGRKVSLDKGFSGMFWPLSCGGSCAPANLWWVQNNVLYHIQKEFSSDTSEQDQERVIVDVANSAIRGGPR